MPETKKVANVAFDLFQETNGAKFERAVAKPIVKGRDELPASYGFRAVHLKHTETTSPIEYVFATVRNRTQ